MKTVELEVDQIAPNPKNYRRTYQGIEKLADSIYTYGLLQNLVVIEFEPGKYHVHAGERRYRAIKLLTTQLTPSGEPRWRGPVRCVVVSAFGLEDVIENGDREAVALWQLGERYAREYENNIDQTMLAAKVGKTQTHISMCLRLHYKLAPKVKRALDKLGPDALTTGQLLMLIKFVDKNDDPLELEQWEKFVELMGRDRRAPRRPGGLKAERERILSRVKHLEQKRVPIHAKPYVDIMLAYLKGETQRLKF
jgi:ParB-like chromosome segregation protein Spo0J